MGSGVVKIESGEVRAKEFPAIDSIKKLLNNRLEADRKATHAEFAKEGITLHKDTTYVFNLADLVSGETQIESSANVIQLKNDKVVRGSNKTNALSSKDTLEIIGEFNVPKKPNKQSRRLDRIINAVKKTGATIVLNGKIVHKPEETKPIKKVDTKPEEGKMFANDIINAALECAKG